MQISRKQAAVAVLLHVATYNAAACALYEKLRFVCLRTHLDFYAFSPDRTPLPPQTRFDGFLYALPLVQSGEAAHTRAGAQQLPTLLWLSRGWSAALAAVPFARCAGPRRGRGERRARGDAHDPAWRDHEESMHAAEAGSAEGHALVAGACSVAARVAAETSAAVPTAPEQALDSCNGCDGACGEPAAQRVGAVRDKSLHLPPYDPAGNGVCAATTVAAHSGRLVDRAAWGNAARGSGCTQPEATDWFRWLFGRPDASAARTLYR
jgi:hypothetical protein